MGQRHQVYMRFKNDQKNEVEVVGLHHQWLYGYTAIHLLNNLLKYYKKTTKKYSPMQSRFSGNPLKLLEANYSYAPEIGYYHPVSLFSNEDEIECCKNPELGDNNDGITLIDFTKTGKPKIAFINFFNRHKYDNNIESREGEEIVEAYTVIKPKDYVELYYDIEDMKKTNKEPEFVRSVERVVRSINANSVLMTIEEVKDMFPDWKKLSLH